MFRPLMSYPSKGTAYITDVGMTGGYEGVIGVKREIIIKNFDTVACPARTCQGKKAALCGVLRHRPVRQGREHRAYPD